MSASTEIILADGIRAWLETETALLAEIGYEKVRTARSGTEAWTALKSYPVDMVIASWSLPELDGLALIKVIRADPEHSSLPILIMVEEVTRQQVIEAGQAGVTDIVIRPFTKKMFEKKIASALSADQDERRVKSKEYLKQGEALMEQGKLNDALVCFQKVLEVNEYAEVYYNLGYIKTAQTRYEEAILAFRKATEINNDFVQAYKKMGEVYARMGRGEESEACFEKAAEIYMEKNMDKAAEDVYLEALKFNPQTINVYNSLGILYRRRGKLQDSIRMYRKALRVNPDDENVHYNLAKVYMAVKNFTEAAKILKKSLILNPDFHEAADLLQSLEMGEGLR